MSPSGFEKNGDFTSGMTLTLGKLQGSDPAAKWNMDIEIYSKIELCFNICLLERHYNRN